MIEIKNLKTNESYKSFVQGIEPEFPSWVSLLDPSREELYKIQSTFSIPWEDLEDSLDEDERPRIEVEEEFIKLVLRVPGEISVEPNEKTPLKPTTHPVVIFLKGSHLITIQNVPIKTKNKIGKKLGVKKPRTSPTIIVLLYWLEEIVKSYELAVETIDQSLRKIEVGIFKSTKSSSIENVFILSRQATYLDAALKGNLGVYYKIQKLKVFSEDPELLDDVEDLSIDLQQQNDLLSIYRDLIESSLDAYASVISNNQSDLIKVLTSVSLILTIPTMLASLYGMNVRLPFGDASDPNAFWIIVILSIILIAPIWLILRRVDLL